MSNSCALRSTVIGGGGCCRCPCLLLSFIFAVEPSWSDQGWVHRRAIDAWKHAAWGSNGQWVQDSFLWQQRRPTRFDRDVETFFAGNENQFEWIRNSTSFLTVADIHQNVFTRVPLQPKFYQCRAFIRLLLLALRHCCCRRLFSISVETAHPPVWLLQVTMHLAHRHFV